MAISFVCESMSLAFVLAAVFFACAFVVPSAISFKSCSHDAVFSEENEKKVQLTRALTFFKEFAEICCWTEMLLQPLLCIKKASQGIHKNVVRVRFLL